MDVQTENTDPPPCESQPSGKIRKGFKLFGKRKPGNIFSMRSKGDGNNKSPVIRSRTMDGLSDTPAPDSEQDTDKEKAQEVSQGESEQAEEEPLSDDGVLAAAPARTSISSTSSAKSLSFLSLLRGGRRGVGDRRAQTVSQPAGRQRRGLKDLFGSVKFRSKDKDDRKSAPPSPLLMSSRANSVEIIKEDLTLTPKSQPRSLDSPGTETCETLKSLTGQDSAATSPSKSPQVATGNVSKTTEHVTPLSTPEPPLVPGDTSLSSLLADISSLLTFDSITGGDIMADVEAEWGKATSTAVTEVSPSSMSPFSKPAVSPKLTSTFVSTAVPVKPSPVATVTTASSQPLTPLTKAISSPISKPSSIITTFTKSSTLTTQSVKLSSDSTPTTELKINLKISTPAPAENKLSNAPATLTSFSAPAASSSSMTNKCVPSVTSTIATAPSTTPSTVVKAPVVSSVLTATTTKLASEIAVPQKPNASVSKPSSVATSSSTSDKPAAATHSPPISVAPVQPPPDKLDLAKSFNLQTSTADKSRSVAGGDSKAVIVTSACTITTQSSSHALTSETTTIGKTTTVSMPATVSGSVSVTMSKPIPTSSPMNLNKTPSSHVPDVSSSTLPVTSKTLPGPAPLQISSSASLDKTPLTTKPTSLPSSTDKIPAIPEPVPAPTTQAAISTASPTPAAPPQVPVVQSKSPAVPAPTPVSVSKDLPTSTKIQDSQPKPSPSPAQVPVSVTKEPTAPVQMQVFQSTPPKPPVQIPVSVLKAHPFTPITPAPVATDTPASVSVSKDIPAPAQIPLPQSKAPSALVTMPCPVTPPVSTPAPEPATLNNTSAHGVQSPLIKTEEQPNETQRNLHGPSKEKKTSQPRPSGLSKIPIVGGGRGAKLPVRDSQHADEEPIRDPPTPVLEEEKPHLNSHDAGSKEKSIAVEAKSPPSKRSPEESPQQSKASVSSGRDSKIPVKHGVQSHTASQIPQSKEPPRTKIPVSKVPVRRVGNRPASTSSSQIRK